VLAVTSFGEEPSPAVNRQLQPFYEYRSDGDRESFTIRPVGRQVTTDACRESWFLYPFGMSRQTESTLRWKALFTLMSFDRTPEEWKFHLLPFIFKRKSIDPSRSYGGLFPAGGDVKNLFGREEIRWFCWPLYVRTYRGGEINHWFPWPFLNTRDGNGSHGFGFWPLGGHFYSKGVYDERYCLWPLIYNHRCFQKNTVKKGFLPFYAYEKSPNVEDTTVVWPFLGKREEKYPEYREERLLWPLWVQGKGDRYVNRWAPFYTHSSVRGLNKKWYAWPLFRQMWWRQGSILIRQEQFLYFVFWTQRQTDARGHLVCEKTHFWPFYSYWKNGKEVQFQSFSPFEVFFPNSDPIRRLYSPLFAFYRSHCREDGTRSQKIFFNFIREEKAKDEKTFNIALLLDYSTGTKGAKFELFKGLLGYQKTGDNKTLKLFWHSFPVGEKFRRRGFKPRKM
jgi:hypothetical protein